MTIEFDKRDLNKSLRIIYERMTGEDPKEVMITDVLDAIHAKLNLTGRYRLDQLIPRKELDELQNDIKHMYELLEGQGAEARLRDMIDEICWSLAHYDEIKEAHHELEGYLHSLYLTISDLDDTDKSDEDKFQCVKSYIELPTWSSEARDGILSTFRLIEGLPNNAVVKMPIIDVLREIRNLSKEFLKENMNLLQENEALLRKNNELAGHLHGLYVLATGDKEDNDLTDENKFTAVFNAIKQATAAESTRSPLQELCKLATGRSDFSDEAAFEALKTFIIKYKDIDDDDAVDEIMGRDAIDTLTSGEVANVVNHSGLEGPGLSIDPAVLVSGRWIEIEHKYDHPKADKRIFKVLTQAKNVTLWGQPDGSCAVAVDDGHGDASVITPVKSYGELKKELMRR